LEKVPKQLGQNFVVTVVYEKSGRVQGCMELAILAKASLKSMISASIYGLV